MASASLAITTLTVGQTGKETTANTALLKLENATQRTYEADMSGGDVALTEAQWTSNYVFDCTGLAADQKLTVPDEVASNGANTAERVFAVKNSSTTYLVTVEQDATGDVVVVLPGESAKLRADGTNVFRIDNQFDFGGYLAGQPSGSAKIFRMVTDRPFRLPSGLGGAQANLGTAATAQTDYDLQKNGASIGTMRFAAAATTATFIFASDVDFAIGDVFGIVAPASPDSTAADHSWMIPGYKM